MDLPSAVSSNSDDLSSIISQQLNKIQELKDCLSLHFRRDQLQPELKELNDRMPDIQEQLEDCDKLLENYQKNVVDEYEKVMATMRKQQTAMLYVLTEIEKKNQSAKTKSKTAIATAITPQNNQLETPRLFLSDYEKSPYISKIRPVALQFIDFDVTLSLREFEEIPKYMRGRESFDELNSFLQNIIVPCFTEKYQLIHRKRECVRNPHDLKLWKVYHEQVSYFPGQRFITQGDISQRLNKCVDKKVCSRIAMLRHLKILQEHRKSSVICYVWIAANNGDN